MSEFLHSIESHPLATPDAAPRPAAGKSTLTSRLAPRSTTNLIFRVESAEAAHALADRFGPRDGNGVTADADVAVDLAARSSGQALPGPARATFEQSLGADLSSVRVHTGAESEAAARAVGARAYTVGNDIHFGEGQFAPADPFGLHLLAHEVAHTQQQDGAAPTRQHKLEVSTPGDAAEVEADRAADRMVLGAPVQVSSGGGVQRRVQRDLDANMEEDKRHAGHAEVTDVKVQTINSHSVIADQDEARGVLANIRGAEPALKKLVAQDDKYGRTLGDNAASSFRVQEYLAAVGDSGSFLGEFQASYFHTKKDYGEFSGTMIGLAAGGGKLGADKSHVAGLNSLRANPAFAQMLKKYEDTGHKLKDDSNTLQQNQDSAAGKALDLRQSMMKARAGVAAQLQHDKEGALAGILASIDATVDTIMAVGQIAMTCISGVMAMGNTGFDVNNLVESNPTSYTPPEPKADAPAAAAAPAAAKADAPAAASGAAPAIKTAAAPGPADLRSYNGKPSVTAQATGAASTAASAGISLAGGPKEVLRAALTKLESSKINVLSAEIGAAKVEVDLSSAAAAAAEAASVKQAYTTAINTMIQNIETMLTDKRNLENQSDQLVGMAKQTNPNLAATLRVLTAGDKFLSQVDLTISLGRQSVTKGKAALNDRYAIAGGAGMGDPDAPLQLTYWTAERHRLEGLDSFLHGPFWYTLKKNDVVLKASGKDSLNSSSERGGKSGTIHDVQQALDELEQWKADVTAKRDQARASLGSDDSSGRAQTT